MAQIRRLFCGAYGTRSRSRSGLFADLSVHGAGFLGRVIKALRDGVTGHFTMGGHYASFEPAEILQQTPGLDSVVRFDGEMTLVKILHCLSKGEDWRKLPGIAFRSDEGQVVVAPLAKVVENLIFCRGPIGSRLTMRATRCRLRRGAGQPRMPVGLFILQYPALLREPGRAIAEAPQPARGRRRNARSACEPKSSHLPFSG